VRRETRLAVRSPDNNQVWPSFRAICSQDFRRCASSWS